MQGISPCVAMFVQNCKQGPRGGLNVPLATMTSLRYEVVLLQERQICRQERCDEIGRCAKIHEPLLLQHGWLPPGDT